MTCSVTGLTFCPGSDISIDYTVYNGACNAGNVFIAQLSDASGSFSSPAAIGAVSSRTSGTINATIPLNTPGGTGYRIRVVSSNPSGTGNDNGTDLAVIPLRSIGGAFSYYNIENTPLTHNIAVGIYQDDIQVGQDFLVTDGSYSFSNLCPGKYEFRITSDASTDGSVNTTDAAQVNNWGIVPYSIEKVRFYAGDVALEKWLSATNAFRIQQYFVTAGATVFDRSAWTFWKAGDHISSNPATAPDYPVVTVTGSGNLTANFYGLCTGDFNCSFDPSGKKSGNRNLWLMYSGTRQAGPGQDLDLPVRVVNASVIGAISMILNFPPDLVEVKDVFVNGTGGHLDWAVKGDELRIGWNSLAPLDLAASSDLLTLRLKTSAAFTTGSSIKIVLSSSPLNELADDRSIVIDNAVVSLDAIDGSGTGTEMQPPAKELKFSNHPNPFNAFTIITYFLPFDGKVSIEIRNLMGETMNLLVNEVQSSGDHSLRFDAGSLGPGIYTAIIRLRGKDELSRTIKLVNSR
jgi:hypothetical protein